MRAGSRRAATSSRASGSSSAAGTRVLFHCTMPLTMRRSWAAHETTPRAKHSTRSPPSSDSGFPGGPAVEHEAASGNPKAFDFPRSFLNDASPRVQFQRPQDRGALCRARSGSIEGRSPATGQLRADLAASFQQAVVDVLVAKCRQALVQTGLKRLAVGGGVIANKVLRSALEAMARKEGAELFIPPMSLCTDNAAMAALAVEKWRRNEFAPLDLDAEPNFL